MFGLKKLVKTRKRVGGPADLSITNGADEEEVTNKIEGERSIPNVARRGQMMSRPVWIGVTCLTFIALAAVAFTSRDSGTTDAAKEKKETTSTPPAPRTTAALAPLELPDLAPTKPIESPSFSASSTPAQASGSAGAIAVIPNGGKPPPGAHVPAISGSDVGAPPGGSPAGFGGSGPYPQTSGGKRVLSPEEEWRKRRLEGGLVAYQSGATTSGAGPADTGPGQGMGGGPGPGPSAGASQVDEYSNKLRVTAVPDARAMRLMDRNFLLGRGKMIDCTTLTRIDTTQPGQLICTNDADVYSDNGNVLLLEKGTEFIGTQKNGLQQGQARVFILWEEARTPKGVRIQLASPAADSLGAPGVDGYVDTHFWQRFGGALMLSIVQDATSKAGSQAPSTTGAGRDAVAEALHNSVNIPPTLRKNHAQTITVAVARDIDFRPVYSLEATK